MAPLGSRLRYAAGQGVRVAWYVSHYAAINRMRGPLRPAHEEPFRPKAPIPRPSDLFKSMRDLFERDYQNIAAGVYRAPERGGDPRRLIDKSIRFLLDAKKVDERRRAKGHGEVRRRAPEGQYPNYYLQNFHFQTDGWLSEASADLYDTQVETLFAGTADAMRRQALVPISSFLEGQDQRRIHLLDVACGTGRFLREVKRNWPGLNVTGLDLSPDYVAKTEKVLKRWGRVQTVRGAAEKMPVAAKSQDIVTATYLFHELPPKIRKAAAKEIARVLKSGGLFVFVDALQVDDHHTFNALLEFFPEAFHEPYFSTYVEEDFDTLFRTHGLFPKDTGSGYLTKVVAYRKAKTQ
jgi:ubiquinone/menaquinone biosynthesis C-methylase UbiE